MQSTKTEDWLFVSKERAADAEAIVNSRSASIGSVYLVGYGVECGLKAYLKAKNTPFPTSGRAGHDLKALWKASGFSKRDIKDLDGTKGFYFESWKTDLRYFTTVAVQFSSKELLEGARQVVQFLHREARRESQRGRR